MIKLSILVTLGIACVSGCANQSAAPEPKTPASDVDSGSSDREESVDAVSSADADEAKPKSDKADAEEGKSSASKADADAENKPLGGVKERPAKQSCKEHTKKSDCEVAVGCAWSTTKVCVDQ
ncbi:MAG TPA: hypothetical protein VIV60_13655 [Polyangiaceae bacterium]